MRNPPSSSTLATSTTEASGRTKTTPCCSKVGLKRGPWTAEEDEILANFINREGEGKWRTLPKRANLLRCGKSCRLRWMNYLRPCVKRGHIDPDEEDLILRLHRLLGNRWSLIAGRIPGRTDNEIKNYWNTHLSKKLISQGIDPRTHKPLSDVQINNNNNNNSTKPSTAPPNPNLMLPSNYNSEDSNSGVVVGSAADHTSPMAAEICFDLAAGNNTFHNPNLNANQHLNFNDMITCGESRGSFEDQEDDPNYCTDEVFSSFLNSLINEDMFTSQGQQQLPRYDALLPQPTQSALAFGAPSWDATPPDDQPQ